MGKPKKKPRRFGIAGGRHSFRNRCLRRSIEVLKQQSILDAPPPPVYYTCQESGSLKLTLKAGSEPPTQNRDGYRVINLQCLNYMLLGVSRHVIECQAANKRISKGQDAIKLVGVSRDRGLAATLPIVCLGCGNKMLYETSTTVSVNGDNHYDINVRAVWGHMSTGSGCAKMREALATMGMPSMSAPLFTMLEDEIGALWRRLLMADMAVAAEEEKQLAIASGQFHEGVPWIAVICDGGWSKRTHKHSYNALGGVGIVIGLRTGKLLHIGIRNKICYVCTYAETKGVEVRPHVCEKNWTKSSQAMEADIFLQAFSEAEGLYGLRYLQLLADGDSSTLATLRSQGPPWCREISKLECANHAVKCLRGSLEKIVTDNPHFKGHNKLCKPTRVRLTIVRCAIRMRSGEADTKEAVIRLRHDIRNSVNHVFGHHDQCNPDVCKASHPASPASKPTARKAPPTKGNANSDPALKCLSKTADMWNTGVLLQDQEDSRGDRPGGKVDVAKEIIAAVLIPLNRMAEKADRLIGNHTTNLAEMRMSLRMKFDGGKVINRFGKGSWPARCYGAALRRNLGSGWSSAVWESGIGTPPTTALVNFGVRVAHKRLVDKLSRARPSVQARTRKRKAEREKQDNSKQARMSYGSGVPVETPDIPAPELKSQCENFYQEKVVLSAEKCHTLEVATRQQTISECWKEQRRIGECSLVRRSGLTVNVKWPFLGASPDGIVLLNGVPSGLVEYKNLLKNKPITLLEAAKTPNFCLEVLPSGSLRLKKRHKFYFQSQGLLQISQFPWIDFVVRAENPHQLHVERIQRDDALWEREMLPKLEAFYFKALLPELAAPRHGLLPGFREPGPLWYVDTGDDAAAAAGKASVADLLPAGPSVSVRSSHRLRQRLIKFVGRQVKHEWIEEGHKSKWYRGKVLRLCSGHDGEPGAEYEVKYHGDRETYIVDHVVEDFRSKSLILL